MDFFATGLGFATGFVLILDFMRTFWRKFGGHSFDFFGEMRFGILPVLVFTKLKSFVFFDSIVILLKHETNTSHWQFAIAHGKHKITASCGTSHLPIPETFDPRRRDGD